MTSIERTALGLSALEFDPGMARSTSIDSLASLFQSILTENRLTPLMRVWLARLQMPLVRQALAQPTMFGCENNVGIDLVTHLVACAIEQESSAVPADALQAEIRRLVLMVEKNASGKTDICLQAHAQFKAFLSHYPGSEEASHLVADKDRQQEQLGVFVVQYSILLRHMLHGTPVRVEVSDFLFKVWAEVLAFASVHFGHHHAQTLALKQAVTALLWATGARKTRRNRARVIKDVPHLLQTLREGMSQLGLPEEEKKRHITNLCAPMMDAFLYTKALDPEPSPVPNRPPKIKTTRSGSGARSKADWASQLTGMEVIDDIPSSQGWVFWERVQAEQKDPLPHLDATHSTQARAPTL